MAPLDFYQILGVPPEASDAEIKAAYRRAVFAHHPDTNPEAGPAEARRFLEVQEAWSVLREPGRRARYDQMRAAGFGASLEDFEAGGGDGGGAYGTPWGQPSVDDKDFDRKFDEWWTRMSEEFDDFEEKQFQNERMAAERRARAEAWEWEKEEARRNKVRAQRLKWRTEDARMARHATTLRRFWQTHAGFTPVDALFVGLVLAASGGIAWAWRSHLRADEQQQQQQHHHQQQHQRQQQQQQPAAHLPAAAAAAAGAAAAPQPP